MHHTHLEWLIEGYIALRCDLPLYSIGSICDKDARGFEKLGCSREETLGAVPWADVYQVDIHKDINAVFWEHLRPLTDGLKDMTEQFTVKDICKVMTYIYCHINVWTSDMVGYGNQLSWDTRSLDHSGYWLPFLGVTFGSVLILPLQPEMLTNQPEQ